MGIASFVLGIIALLFSFIPFVGCLAGYPGALGLILGIVGLILAVKGKKPRGMAITGIILCGLSLWVAQANFSATDKAVKELQNTKFGD